jgi:N-acetylglutamate synthase-like GNAT family acetyltransferase
MEIKFLKDYPDSILLIAQWYYAEWKAIYEASGMSFEDVKKTVEERANRDKIPLAVVGLDAGRVIATGCIKAHDMETRMDLTPWLAGIYVEQNQRCNGHGSMIVRSLEEIARKFGTEKLYLYTPRSATFYERLGWGKYETATHKGRHVTIMERILL